MSNTSTDPQASIALTYQSLNTVDNQTLTRLSQLTLAEIQELKQIVAQMVPAGNLPGFLLHGLIKLQGRIVPQDRVQREVGQLIRGLVDMGLYGTFVMGPAAVLKGYQSLLRLAGKDLDAAFPQGTWQFYTEFALREDPARHGSEVVGFSVPAEADEAALLAAWLYAGAWTLWAYADLLTNEWTERETLRLFREVVAGTVLTSRLGHWPSAEETAAVQLRSDGLSWLEQERDQRLRQLGLHRLAADWAQQRPYWSPPGAADYQVYRRAQFQAFVNQHRTHLSTAERHALDRMLAERVPIALPAYLAQMHLLYALKPENYRESRQPIPAWQARLAVAAEGGYWTVPAYACDAQGRPLVWPLADTSAPAEPLLIVDDQPFWQGRPAHVDWHGRVHNTATGQVVGRLAPARPDTCHQQARAILHLARDLPSDEASTADLILVAAPRAQQHGLRELLPAPSQGALAHLRQAPIIINWHCQRADQPLARIRRGRRGVGDHAITIQRTDRSMVFDLSHIFFDGAWGVALAQIMTHAATDAYQSVAAAPAAGADQCPAPQPVRLLTSPALAEAAAAWPGPIEASAETTTVSLDRINRMRRHLAQRGVGLTVNDVLLLGRCLLDPRYQPHEGLQREVAGLARAPEPAVRQAAADVTAMWEALQTANPSVLIPMDATARDPRERVFPTTFRNPFPQIDEEWTRAVVHLAACRDNPAWSEAFLAVRKEFLNHLRYFGLAMAAIKQVAMQGNSWNTAMIRLLAYLPPGLQHALDWIPQEFEVLNEILKGEDVFSNVGQMAPDSSVRRFISAKDDGRSKVLVWGVLTTADGQLAITLRDFRPPVAALADVGHEALAQRIAQDYLNGYAQLVNQLVSDLDAVATYPKGRT
ncbi:MAG: hypothetical protein KKA73_03255 [Chloroflexi bacterium]|nr:hypothetical protein [Chloroflexota bacterium]MBU1746681.1 hypothetical protein [Chloroflexota bacterium]MBU1877483.1 hypothetical protein [Chloroflexota bacterium]